jgi:SpoVK/Ycf46/Vps4 family AAA+-type ATPase
VSGGLSGAELIGACRDAALLAMEEYEEEKVERNTDPIITMDQLLQTLVNTERQITPSMLEFYASFRSKPKAG